VTGGILSGDALVLQEAFQAIYKEVARREAACGRGLLLEATKGFFWNFGYDARSGESLGQFGVEELGCLIVVIEAFRKPRRQGL
jgi:hypothetical protein